MLGNYLKFNNETFPNPTSPSMASKTLENVSQSEAGTDLVCIVRPSKKSWTFKFTLTSGKAEILEGTLQGRVNDNELHGDILHGKNKRLSGEAHRPFRV